MKLCGVYLTGIGVHLTRSGDHKTAPSDHPTWFSDHLTSGTVDNIHLPFFERLLVVTTLVYGGKCALHACWRFEMHLSVTI
jgi:hypothetical protein